MTAVLVLEDGRIFRGTPYGAVGETFGETVFNTGMTGYQETLTDPSYHRQIVVMTAPHIGNTGVNDEDPESARIWVAGYVVRDPARVPSNWRAQPLPGRRAARAGRRRHRRASTPAPSPGTCASAAPCAPASSPATALAPGRGNCWSGSGQPRHGGRGPGRARSPPRSRTSSRPSGTKRFTVAAVDLGIKAMTPHRMAERGCEVHVLPATATAEESSPSSPDGVFFSNGPGDPATADAPVDAAARGPGRGHPVLRHLLRQPDPRPRARASAPTSCAYGHRGINQPVQDRTHRQGRDHRAQPRLRRGRARSTGPFDTAVRPRRGQPRLPQRRRASRGCGCSTARPSASSTTPRPRPARTTPPTSSTASVELMAGTEVTSAVHETA